MHFFSLSWRTRKELVKECAFDRSAKKRFNVIFPSRASGCYLFKASRDWTGCFFPFCLIAGIGFAISASGVATGDIGTAILFCSLTTLFSAALFYMTAYMDTAAVIFRKRRHKYHLLDDAWCGLPTMKKRMSWDLFIDKSREKLKLVMPLDEVARIERVLVQQKNLGVPVLECHAAWIFQLFTDGVATIETKNASSEDTGNPVLLTYDDDADVALTGVDLPAISKRRIFRDGALEPSRIRNAMS